jgi:8-oxo-dGTP diphosphatase
MRVDVVAAIIRNRNDVLITKRPDSVHLGGFWEFPGGKVEESELLEAALKREIREELGIEIRVHDEFRIIDHDYPSKSVRLHFYNCTIQKGEPQPIGVAELQWVKMQDLGNYRFPPADTELINCLTSEFE